MPLLRKIHKTGQYRIYIIRYNNKKADVESAFFYACAAGPPIVNGGSFSFTSLIGP